MSVRDLIAAIPLKREHAGRSLGTIFVTDADAILSALRAAGYAVVRDVGDSDGNACLNPYSGDYEAGAEGAYNEGWDDCREAMIAAAQEPTP
jgi:hypothetical protein